MQPKIPFPDSEDSGLTRHHCNCCRGTLRDQSYLQTNNKWCTGLWGSNYQWTSNKVNIPVNVGPVIWGPKTKMTYRLMGVKFLLIFLQLSFPVLQIVRLVPGVMHGPCVGRGPVPTCA